MIIFKTAGQLSRFLNKKKKKQSKIGFVPTMGALHQGHLALLNKSLEQNEITVFSIFVNPSQFNDPEDFKKYPVTVEKDIQLIESSGCDVLFLPNVSEIYPGGTGSSKKYELGFLETVLEGKFRPGHFQGVCQVVHRLLDIVMPGTLYIGQKDFQQCRVIKKLMTLINLDKKIQVNIVPTVREEDGLAMSSRNLRLNNTARLKATEISKALRKIKLNIKPENTQQLINESILKLESHGIKIDYVEIVNAETLDVLLNWDGKQKAVVLAAVFIEGVRLIDNELIN